MTPARHVAVTMGENAEEILFGCVDMLVFVLRLIWVCPDVGGGKS